MLPPDIEFKEGNKEILCYIQISWSEIRTSCGTTKKEFMEGKGHFVVPPDIHVTRTGTHGKIYLFS